MSQPKLSIEHAPGMMIAAQGLSGSPSDSLLSVVERTGFVRTLGGADVYLAVWNGPWKGDD